MVEAFSHLLEHLRLMLSHVPGFETLTSAPFLFRPLVMIIIMGIVCGVVGVIINLRCAEFNAEAMVHSIFPGIVAGAVYGGIEWIIPYASVVAIFVAICLTWVTHRHYRAASEAGTAVVLTSFFSIGIILSLWKGDLSGQLEALMFGRLLEVTDNRLFQALIVCVIAFCIIAFTWKEQVMYAFDRGGTRAGGIPVLFLDFALNIALASVVVATSSAIGTLLVIGYIVIPGATARLLASHIKTMLVVSIICGIGGGYIGLQLMNLQVGHPISPQASVALSVVALYVLALIWYVFRHKILRWARNHIHPSKSKASSQIEQTQHSSIENSARKGQVHGSLASL